MPGAIRAEAAQLVSQSVLDCLRASNQVTGFSGDDALNNMAAAWNVLEEQRLTQLGLVATYMTLTAPDAEPVVDPKEAYRKVDHWAEGRRWPSAGWIPQLMCETMHYVSREKPPGEKVSGPAVEKVILEINPFPEDNIRIGHLVRYHLEQRAGRRLIPVTRAQNTQTQRDLMDWARRNYPACGDDGKLKKPEPARGFNWRKGILGELIRL